VAFDVTLPQFDVMAALARKDGGMTMTELSRYLMVSNGNVTGIIDRLVAERMVARATIVADRRATMVRLTPRGKSHFAAIAKAHESWVDELLNGFSRKEVETMIGLLDGFASALRGGEERP
jgi:DNA-binding MarR family transcriptional regulator